jgi:type IV secretory pathway protease TraF
MFRFNRSKETELSNAVAQSSRIPAGAPSAHAARPRVETVPAGHVFLHGDHSTVSIDGRTFGAVPVDEIVARYLVNADLP